mmetsp:Transcript_15638/g.39964  ORF Transcript_15638/g.39964 Transcript_15638/m.39964 type:complete len:96 (-) Transcript_15638:1473-1760(-)
MLVELRFTSHFCGDSAAEETDDDTDPISQATSSVSLVIEWSPSESGDRGIDGDGGEELVRSGFSEAFAAEGGDCADVASETPPGAWSTADWSSAG